MHRSHRPAQPRSSCVCHPTQRGSDGNCSVGGHCIDRNALPVSTRRHSSGAQGHVLPSGRANHIRSVFCPLDASGFHRNRQAAARRVPRAGPRWPQFVRIRGGTYGCKPPSRTLCQSVVSRSPQWWLFERIRRSGGSRNGLCLGRLGYGRIDPDSSGVLRRDGPQANLWPCQPAWCNASCLESGQCRPDCPERTGLLNLACRNRRPRRFGSSCRCRGKGFRMVGRFAW